MIEESSHPPINLRDDLRALAELLHQSSFGTEATRSLRDRSPWRTAEQAQSSPIELDLTTLVVATRPATDVDVEARYQRILSLCQIPISVVEAAARARLPLQVVTVLLSDLINQRLILFRSPVTPTAESSSHHVLQGVLAGLNKIRQDSGTELADDASTVSGVDERETSKPITETGDANLEQALATSGFFRLPVRWQEVLWWTDVEGLSPTDAAPILGLTPNGVAALAYRARQSLTQSYTWARLDHDAQQRTEGQEPGGHDQPFGALLRRLRLAAGMSLSELARRIHYSKAQLSKIEYGYTLPTLMFAKMCDRELDTGGMLARALPPQPARIEIAKPDEVWVLGLDESGSLHFTALPRRQVLAGATALLGYAVSRRDRTDIDDRTLATLRASFEHHRTLGTIASPEVLLGPVIAHVHTLRTLAADNPEPMRSELQLLAARVAEYAGWLCQEIGRETDALRWLDRAVTLAAGRDPQLANFAQFRHAEIALNRHNPLQTIELARRAQQNTAAGPRILGLAASCEAQGHALTGDVRGYEEAMDRADNLLAVRDEADSPILGSASVPNEVSLVRGWSLYDLGRPGAAAELLDTQLAVLPSSARRARARFGIRRALAHAANGAIDQACVAAVEVLPDVVQVGSVTCRLDLRELSRALSRWSTAPAVRDLQQKLITVLDAQS